MRLIDKGVVSQKRLARCLDYGRDFDHRPPYIRALSSHVLADILPQLP